MRFGIPKHSDNMKLNDIFRSLMLKRTWVRVDEITRFGYYKDEEKRVLFRGPVSKDDVLPLAISYAMGFFIVLVMALISLSIFPWFINVMLGLILLLIIFLPAYLARIYFKDRT